jgi:hypothetical protein
MIVGGGSLPLGCGFRRLLDKERNREGAGDPHPHPLFGAGTSVIRGQTWWLAGRLWQRVLYTVEKDKYYSQEKTPNDY